MLTIRKKKPMAGTTKKKKKNLEGSSWGRCKVLEVGPLSFVAPREVIG